MSTDIRYWIGFNLVKGIGPIRVRGLLDHFGDLAAAWTASAEELQATGLDRRALKNLLAARAQVDLDLVLQRLDKVGARALNWESAEYPRNLRNIAQPPPVLFVKGALTPADEWAVAMVGTRQASASGRRVTQELAGQLAASGVTVVSGLARGIDSEAHRAALEAGGRTIAVLGCGIDRVYPPEHAGLAGQIAQAGAVVSDYPLGMPPDSANFPPRNRIISGLSKGVVVVEAGESSGALITARFAAEQGRDVFAVPGSILVRSCRGSNRLIQDGAKPVLGAADILEELNLVMAVERAEARLVLPANETEKQLLDCLSAEPLHVDEIGARLALPIDKVTGTLALLELKGMVQQVGGMNYVLARESRPAYTIE